MAAESESQPKRLKLAVEPHHERPVVWIYDDGRNQFEVEKTPAEKLFDRVRQLDFGVSGDEIEKTAAAGPGASLLRESKRGSPRTKDHDRQPVSGPPTSSLCWACVCIKFANPPSFVRTPAEDKSEAAEPEAPAAPQEWYELLRAFASPWSNLAPYRRTSAG